MSVALRKTIALAAAVALAASCTNPLESVVENAVAVAKGPKLALTLSGTALASGGSCNLGQVNVGDTYAATFTVTNNGKTDLVLSNGAGSVMVSGTDSGQFSVSSAPGLTTIPVGQSTTFALSFSPTSAGTKTADVTIASNDPSTASFSLTVTGEGVNTGAVVKPTFSMAQGLYNYDITVAMSCATAGATIYYTTDNTDPTTSSSAYGSPVSVAGNGTLWYLKAIGVKEGMDSSSIATAIYMLNYNAPSIPAGLAATGGSGQVTLTWTKSDSRTDSYNLYYAKGASVTTDTGTKVSGITATTYTLTGLDSGTQYAFIITGASTLGESTACEVVTAYTLCTPPTISAQTAGTGSMTVSWGAVAGAASYNLYHKAGTSVDTTSGTKVAGITATSYTVSGLANTVADYAFIVTAVNAGNAESAASSSVTKKTPPAKPSITSATGGVRAVTVIWSAVADASSYNLYWKAGASVSTSSYDGKVTGASSGSAVTMPADGTTYAFILTAVGSENGESTASDVVTAATSVVPVISTTSATTSSITITWGSVTDAASYNLYYKAGSTATTSSTKVAGVSSSYELTGLSIGTTYSFIVTAVGSAGNESGASAVKTVTTIPGQPTITTTGGTKQVTVTWSAVTGATYYNLYWLLGSSVTTSTGTLVSGITSTSQTVTGLSDGATYAFILTAANASGTGTASSVATAITTPPTPTLSISSATTSSVTLSWGTVSGATSYNLYWVQGSTASTSSTKIPGATTPYTLNSLTAGMTYAFVVTAVGTGGESLACASQSTTTIPGTPSTPSATGGTNQVTVSWSAVTGATYYNLYYKAGSTVTTSDGTPVTGITTTSKTVTGLADGTTYAFIIQAANANGAGTASAVATAITTPPAPTLSISSVTSSSLTVSWNTVSGATSYNLYWTQGSTANTSSTKITGATSPREFNSLTPGMTYAFVVTAVGTGGESAPSTNMSTTTIPGVPSIPSATSGTNQVTVSWSAVMGATYYNVFYKAGTSVSSSSGGYDGVQSTSSTPFTVGSLANGTTYAFIVQAVNANGAGAASSSVTATTTMPAPTGVSVTTTTTMATVSWNSVSNASSYNLYYLMGSSSVSTTNYTGSVVGATSGNAVSGLSTGTLYSFIVTAVTADTQSAASSTVTAYTIPASPTISSVTPSSSEASVTVAWQSVTGGNSYTLYYNEGSSVSSSGDYDGSHTTTGSSYTVSGLSNGTQYAFTVTAVGTGGTSADSGVVTVTTVPPTPLSVNASQVSAGNGTVMVTVNPAMGAESYRLYYKQGSTVSTSDYEYMLSSTGTMFTINSCTLGKQYAFCATAVNSSGESAATAPVTVTLALAAPTNLTVTNFTSSSVTVSWSASNGALYYFVYYQTGSEVSTSNYIWKDMTSSTSYTVINLSSNTQYAFIVTAAGEAGDESAASTIVTALTATQ